MPKFSAFWISPDGVVHVVPKTHLRQIASNPEMFGLTREKVLAVFRKHHESLIRNSDGKARAEIVGSLLKAGWIRIRRHNGFYESQFDTESEKSWQSIQSFFSSVIETYQGQAHWDLVVVSVDGLLVDEKNLSDAYRIAHSK